VRQRTVSASFYKVVRRASIAREVFSAMTTCDIEIAEAELTDNIPEKDDSKDGNAGGVRGDLPILKEPPAKRRAGIVLLAKGGQKWYNSDDEEIDENMYDGGRLREKVHKGVKIGDGAIILKRKKRIHKSSHS
jgi:hypothetical protein